MGVSIAEQNDILDPLNPKRIDVLLRITTNSELPNDIRLIALSVLIYNRAVDFLLVEDTLLQMKITKDIDKLYARLKATKDTYI